MLIRWMKDQMIQAKKPENFKFFILATAFFFPIVAIEPLSLYSKPSIFLLFKIAKRFSASFFQEGVYFVLENESVVFVLLFQ